MDKSEKALKKADIQKIARKGMRTYGTLKRKYDTPENKGRFLAIDIDSKKGYLGKTSAKALELAKQKHPDKIFYVVRIGFDVAETMARSYKDIKEK